MSESLTRTSLHLFTSDVEKLKARHGYGWSEQVRIIVHQHLNPPRALRVEDLLRRQIVEDDLGG